MRRGLSLTLALVLCGPVAADAQLTECRFRGEPDALAERESPLDSLVIRLGDAEAKLCYGRPSTGGRRIVGAEHPYGSAWQMGANEPTTLHLPFPARIGPVGLEPGAYSLYAIPGEEEWTIVVNGNPNRWGVPISADVRAADIGSVAVTPRELPAPVETLTFRFEGSGPGGGSLVYEWERTRLVIPFARR